MPPAVANLHVNRVTDLEMQRCIDDWSRRYAESTVRRYRASISRMELEGVRDDIAGFNRGSHPPRIRRGWDMPI